MDDKFRIIYIGSCNYMEFKYTVPIGDMLIPVWYCKNHYDERDIVHKTDHILITDENVKKEEVYNYITDRKGLLKSYNKRFFKDDNYYNFFTPTSFKKYCQEINIKYSKKLEITPRKIIFKNYRSHSIDGTCGSSKQFELSKKLIFHDKKYIVETICHEMVHSIGYRHHKKSFWRKLEWLLNE